MPRSSLLMPAGPWVNILQPKWKKWGLRVKSWTKEVIGSWRSKRFLNGHGLNFPLQGPVSDYPPLVLSLSIRTLRPLTLCVIIHNPSYSARLSQSTVSLARSPTQPLQNIIRPTLKPHTDGRQGDAWRGATVCATVVCGPRLHLKILPLRSRIS